MANRARTRNAGGEHEIDAGRSPAPDDASETMPGEERSRSKPDPTGNTPGQLAVDDRGNISWEWADDPELLADDIVGNTARLRALAPKDLELSDEEPVTINPPPIPVRKSPKSGYNPYNSGEPIKESWKKKRDLRQLGKWIELKKRMRKKPDED